MSYFSQCGRQALFRCCSPLVVALVLALTGAAMLWVPVAQAESPAKISTGEVGAVVQAATLASPSVVLTATPETTVYGQIVTMTATVQSLAQPTPTGSVDFLDGALTLGTAILVDGVAMFTTTALNLNDHTLIARYSGDGNYNPGDSPSVSHTVIPAGTTTIVVPSPNPAVRGQMVTIAATVLPQFPSSGTPDGTVTFKDGATVLHVATLTAGTANFVTPALLLGDHPLSAGYSGSAAFTASSSDVVTQTINRAGTEVLVDSAPRPSVFGEVVTITATVVAAAPGSGTPTGVVTFTDSGDTTIGIVPLVNGVASVTTTNLAVGAHVITVKYGGDTDYIESPTQVWLHESILAQSATTIVSSDPNPSIHTMPVTFTATVTAVPPGAGVPTGTVNILDDQTVVATGTVVSGVAVIVTPDLTLGTHYSITAVYRGNEEFKDSTSTAVEHVVIRQPTTVTVDAASALVQLGLRVSLTATVTSALGTPISGTVTFYDGANVLRTVPALGGVATLSALGLAPGVHAITAAYSGDALYAPSTSEAKDVTIDLRATSTQLGSSPNPSNIGRQASFVALVSPASIPTLQASGADATGAAMPTGLVLFGDATGTLSATVILQDGIARLVTSALPAGVHSVTAQYSGDGTYAPSISQVLIHEVLDMVVATNNAAGTAFDTPVTIDVLANDTGSGLTVPPGDVSDPSDGSVVVNPDNSVTYTPDLGVTGINTFTYVARDTYGNVDSALVTVIVGPAFGTDTPPLVGVIDPTGAQTVTFPSPGATMTVEVPPGVYPLPLGDKDILYLAFASMILPLHDSPTGQQYASYAFALGAFLNDMMLPTVPLGQPLLVTIDYDPEVLGAVLPDTLSLYFWDGTQWSTEGITLVSHDVAAHRIVFRLAHLSEFAFFALPRGEGMYLPLVAR